MQSVGTFQIMNVNRVERKGKPRFHGQGTQPGPICTQTRVQGRRRIAESHCMCSGLDFGLRLGLVHVLKREGPPVVLMPSLGSKVLLLFKFTGCLRGITSLRHKELIQGKWLLPPGQEEITW